jgi:YihY family inner membrane protein
MWRVVVGFHSNKGLILSSALAFNILLSILPCFTLLLVALSSLVDDQVLLLHIENNLDLVVPGLSETILAQAEYFLRHRKVAGSISILFLLFFSSIAFTVLEDTMAIIFSHRVVEKRRPLLVSAVIPFLFTLLIVFGLFVTSYLHGALETMDGSELWFFSWTLKLSNVTEIFLYLAGLAGLILLLSSIYMVMPVGKIRLRYALIGGIAAAVLWEIVRRILLWYFVNLSFINVIYGSMTTVVVALLTLEVAAMILLIGAQCIAEYEKGVEGTEYRPPI